jgi:hypothetical protein
VRGLSAAFGACALAAVVPLAVPAPRPAPTAFPGWPAQYDGRTLVALPLGAREAAFARDFPGRVGRFHDGRRQLVLRYVDRATRKLHPASDCFRGSGYAVAPRPVRRDADGRRWSCFGAARAAESLLVCERIDGPGGASWSDVSTWYWSALAGCGPWWAVTVVEPESARPRNEG